MAGLMFIALWASVCLLMAWLSTASTWYPDSRILHFIHFPVHVIWMVLSDFPLLSTAMAVPAIWLACLAMHSNEDRARMTFGQWVFLALVAIVFVFAAFWAGQGLLTAMDALMTHGGST